MTLSLGAIAPTHFTSYVCGNNEHVESRSAVSWVVGESLGRISWTICWRTASCCWL